MSTELTRANSSSGAAKREEQEGSSSGPSVTAILKALKRRWLLASFLSLSLGGLAVTAVWYGLPPPKHVANSVLHVSAVKPSIIHPLGEYGGEFMIYQQSQKALLTSRLVLTAALREPKVNELSIVREQSDPIDWLQRELKVDFKSGPEYMRLSLAGDRPEDVKVLVAAITDAYLKEIVNREHNKQLTHLEHLKDIQSKYAESLRRKNRSIREMSAAIGSGDPQVIATKHKYALETLGAAEKELIKLKSELRRFRLDVAVQVEKEKALAKAEVPAVMVEQEIQRDPTILQEVARKSELQKRLAALSGSYVKGEDDPRLKRFKQELETIQAGIDRRREELRPLVTEQLREQSRRDVKLALAQMREKETKLTELEKQLTGDIEGIRKQTKSLNTGQLDVEVFRQDVSLAEKIAEQVASKARLLEVELLAPARVTLVEEPYVTQDDPTRRKIKASGAAGLGSFCAVLGLVAWLEYRKRRIDGVSEVRDELGIRLLGTIPALPTGRRSGGGERDRAYRSWRGLLTECVDGTRTRLVHAAAVDGVHVVMVTSAVPSEGKTSLASHLAVSLARVGWRTLLVDGDLRLPALHRVLDLPAGPGLSEVLRGETEPESTIQPGGVEDLWVIPAGDPDLRAIQALARGPLPSLLSRLRGQYDYVIIDSPPILPVVDGLLIGQHVDGVILSVLAGVSQVHTVQTAQQRLAELNIRILGAVMNGADLKSLYSPSQRHGYARYYEPQTGGVSEHGGVSEGKDQESH
jgi:polysaccharide biosynthesis transport protein